MSYSFQPMTEDQLNSFELIDEGIYSFEVVRATRKLSKSGNQMAELSINVWDKEGKQHLLYDYLVFSQVTLNIKKVKHFCDAVGLQKQYEEGQLPEELERFSGKVQIGTQESQPRPDGGFYAKKNIVVDYIKLDKEDIKLKPLNNNKSAFIDDDLPF